MTKSDGHVLPLYQQHGRTLSTALCHFSYVRIATHGRKRCNQIKTLDIHEHITMCGICDAAGYKNTVNRVWCFNVGERLQRQQQQRAQHHLRANTRM